MMRRAKPSPMLSIARKVTFSNVHASNLRAPAFLSVFDFPCFPGSNEYESVGSGVDSFKLGNQGLDCRLSRQYPPLSHRASCIHIQAYHITAGYSDARKSYAGMEGNFFRKPRRGGVSRPGEAKHMLFDFRKQAQSQRENDDIDWP